jgi:chemotaxis protein histidine kinase CheA
LVEKDTAPIRVEIDQELVSIVPDYLENRRSDCFLIERLLEEGCLAEIQSLAHRMKGSGGSYGFDVISEIGEVLERAALVPDANVIRSAVEQLKIYLSCIEVSYI